MYQRNKKIRQKNATFSSMKGILPPVPLPQRTFLQEIINLKTWKSSQDSSQTEAPV
jgi:hypothetical protein